MTCTCKSQKLHFKSFLFFLGKKIGHNFHALILNSNEPLRNVYFSIQISKQTTKPSKYNLFNIQNSELRGKSSAQPVVSFAGNKYCRLCLFRHFMLENLLLCLAFFTMIEAISFLLKCPGK